MKNFSNEFVKQNNARILSGFEIQPRYKPESVQPQPAKEKKQDKKGSSRLEADELNLLMAINLHQYKSTLTQIAKVTGLSGYKSTKLFKKLEETGMIKVVKIIKGKGTSKFPVMLEPAYALLNLEEKKYYGKGAGYEHVIWQYIIAGHFSDYRPVIELNKNGKFIDVAVEHDNKLTAIEVAMTSANEKANIEKDFEVAGADKVIVGCKNDKVLEEVRRIVSEMFEERRQNTRVCLLRELLSLKLLDVI